MDVPKQRSDHTELNRVRAEHGLDPYTPPPAAHPLEDPRFEDFYTRQLQNLGAPLLNPTLIGPQERTSRSLQQFLELSEDPYAEMDKIRSADYLARMTGQDLGFTYENFDAMTEVWLGRKHEPASALQAVKNQWDIGVASYRLGKLYTQKLYGNESPELDQQIAAVEAAIPDPDTIKRSLPVEAFKAAAGFLPTWLYAAGESTTLAVGSAGAGAAAGAAIGGVGAVPGAVAGFMAGMTAGTAKNMFEIEAGLAYMDMLNLRDEQGNTIDPGIAKGFALGIGAVNAAIEVGQVFGLPGVGEVAGEALQGIFKKAATKTLRKVMQSQGLAKAVLQGAKQYGAYVGSESLQEMAQEGVTAYGTELAKEISNQVQGTEFERVWRENFDRVMDAGYQSVLGFTVTGGILAGARGVAGSLKEGRKQTVAKSPETITPHSMETSAIAADSAPLEPVVEPQADIEAANQRYKDKQALAQAYIVENEALSDNPDDNFFRATITDTKQGIPIGDIEYEMVETDRGPIALITDIESWDIAEGRRVLTNFRESLGGVDIEFADKDTRSMYLSSAVNYDFGFAEDSLQFTELPVQDRETFAENLKRHFVNLNDQQVDSALKLVDARATKLGMTTSDWVQKYIAEEAFVSNADLGIESRRAAAVFVDEGKAAMFLTRNADFSSFVHEFGHIIERQLSPEESRIINKWSQGDPEQFAVGLEKYLKTGELPSPEMQGAFQKIKEWLSQIYHLGKAVFQVPDEVRAVYDNLFALPEQETDLLPRQEVTPAETVFQTVENTETPEFREWYGESFLKDSQGHPRPVYHQTARQNVPGIEDKGFDTGKVKARATDELVPDGIFLKPDDRDIQIGDAEDRTQIPLYAAIQKPFITPDRDAFKSYLRDNAPEIIAEIDDLNAYDRMMAADWEQLYQSGASTQELQTVLDDWNAGLALRAGGVRALITDHLRSLGHDGMVINEDTGSFGRRTETIIAFEPTQVKSVDNQGTWDAHDPRILFQDAELDRPNPDFATDLEKAKTVEITVPGERKELSKKDLTSQVSEYYNNTLRGTSIHIPAIGKVQFSKRGGGKSISSASDPVKLFSFFQLRELLENAVSIGTHENRNQKKTNVKEYNYLVTKIMIEDQKHLIWTSVFKDDKGDWYYNHKVYDIKNSPLVNPRTMNPKEQRATSAFSELNLFIRDTFPKIKGVPEILFQNSEYYNHLRDTARDLQSWEEFRDMAETLYVDLPDVTDLDEQARNAWYKNFYEEAVGPTIEERLTLDDMNQEFLDSMNTKEAVTRFLQHAHASGALRDNHAGRGAYPIILANQKRLRAGKELTDASFRIIRGLFEQDPTFYRYIQAQIDQDPQATETIRSSLSEKDFDELFKVRLTIAESVEDPKERIKLYTGDKNVGAILREYEQVEKDLNKAQTLAKDWESRWDTLKRRKQQQDTAFGEEREIYEDALHSAREEARTQSREAREELKKEQRTHKASIRKMRQLNQIAKKDAAKAERERIKEIIRKKQEKQRIRDYTFELADSVMRTVNYDRVDFEHGQAIEFLQQTFDPAYRSAKTIRNREITRAFITKLERLDPHFLVSSEAWKIAQKKAINEFTIEELEHLAREVDRLYREGRQKRNGDIAKIQHRRNNMTAKFVKALVKGAPLERAQFFGSLNYLEEQKKGESIRLSESEYARPYWLLKKFDGETLSIKEFEDLNPKKQAVPVNEARKATKDTKTKGPFEELIWDGINSSTDEALQQSGERINRIFAEMKRLEITAADLTKVIEHQGIRYNLQDVMYMYGGLKESRTSRALEWGNQIPTVRQIVGKLDLKYQILTDFIMEEYSRNHERIREAYIQDKNHDIGKVQFYLPMIRKDIMGGEKEKQAAHAIAEQMGFTQNYTDKGFTKHRIDISNAHQTPIRTDLFNIVLQSIYAQEHYIASWERVKDLQQVIKRETFKIAMQQAYGAEYHAWLQRYLNQFADPKALKDYDALNKWAGKVLSNMALARLAFNMGTVLKQIPSGALYAGYSGVPALFSASAKFMRNPQKWIDFVNQRDPQMQYRVQDQTVEALKKLSENKSYIEMKLPLYNQAKAAAAKWGMLPIQIMDKMVTTIGWLATYDNAISKGLPEADAIKKAQNATLITQPAGRAKDLPLMYRKNNAWLKMFTMFTNQPNQIFNLMRYGVPNAVKNQEYRWAMATLAAITTGFLAMGLIGDVDIPEEDWPEQLGKWITMGMLNVLPLIGKDITSGIMGWDSSGSVIGETVNMTAKAAKDLQEGKIEKAVSGLVEAGAVSQGAPYTGLKKFWRAIKEGDIWEIIGRHDE